jgi:hypothetical protein
MLARVKINQMALKTFWLSLWLSLAIGSAGAQEAWQRAHDAGNKAAREAPLLMLKSCFRSRSKRRAA